VGVERVLRFETPHEVVDPLGWIIALVAGTGAALVLAFVLSFSTRAAASTSATSSGCSGSTSRWRCC